MTLDELYGPGAYNGLVSAFTPPAKFGVNTDVQQSPIPNGVRVYVYWTKGTNRSGFIKGDYYFDHVHFLSMQLDATIRSGGMLSNFVEAFLTYYASLGINTVTLTPHDNWSSWVFQRTGAEPISNTLLSYKLITQPTSRWRGYVDWKLHKGPEPNWHSALAAQQPPVIDDGIAEDA